MTLRVPSYAQIKAFYGLSALVPLSFFVALGFAMTMRIRALALPVGVLLFLWTTNSYVSTWIPAGGSRHMYLGLWHSIEGRTDAAQTELQIAARTSVNDPIPLTALSTTLYQAGKRNEALAPAEAAVRIAPGDGAAHLQLGKVLGSRNETERALTELRRAVELSPENISAYKFLSFLLLQTNAGQAIDAASDGLAVSPFSADLHYNLAAALRQREDYVAATTQLAYAQILRPDMQQTVSEMRQALAKAAQSRNALQDLAKSAPDCSILLANLAWLLATESDPSVRDGALAERLAERGCAVTNDDDPECLASLSAAQAERGRFRDAIATAEKALALARTRNATQLVSRLETAAAAFRNGEPYREGAAR
jgi:Flp pilus assembly protein TadD